MPQPDALAIIFLYAYRCCEQGESCGPNFSFAIRSSGYCIRIAHFDKRVIPSISYNAERTEKFLTRVPQIVNY